MFSLFIGVIDVISVSILCKQIEVDYRHLDHVY
jgi:hypothetical protein